MVQIDAHHARRRRTGRARRQPTEPVVTSLAAASELYPDLVESGSARWSPPTTPSSPATTPPGATASSSTCPPASGSRRRRRSRRSTTPTGAALGFRTLIVLEEGAEAEVWEQWLATDHERDGLFNTVIELWVGPGATLRYVSAQDLGEHSWIFATQRAEVERDANLDWVALGFGSARGKVRMETRLAGPGLERPGHRRLRGQRLASTSTSTRPRSTPLPTPPPTSPSAASSRSPRPRSGAGMIRVDPGAQQTDAFQESRNLLLSKSAHADAIPGLEIEADDVRCTHAAAIAQIDPEQLHYLRSHGLPIERGEAADHRGLPRGAGRAARPRARCGRRSRLRWSAASARSSASARSRPPDRRTPGGARSGRFGRLAVLLR